MKKIKKRINRFITKENYKLAQKKIYVIYSYHIILYFILII